MTIPSINNHAKEVVATAITIIKSITGRRLTSIIMAVKLATTKVIISLTLVSRMKAITSITNTTVTSKTATSITKVRDIKSARMAVSAKPVSLTSIATARKSTSTMMMVAKISATITSTMATNKTALIVTSQTWKAKCVTEKSAFIINDTMVKKIDGNLLTSLQNKNILPKLGLSFQQKQLTCSTI